MAWAERKEWARLAAMAVPFAEWAIAQALWVKVAVMGSFAQSQTR